MLTHERGQRRFGIPSIHRFSQGSHRTGEGSFRPIAIFYVKIDRLYGLNQRFRMVENLGRRP